MSINTQQSRDGRFIAAAALVAAVLAVTIGAAVEPAQAQGAPAAAGNCGDRGHAALLVDSVHATSSAA
jgi:hypothetical protein